MGYPNAGKAGGLLGCAPASVLGWADSGIKSTLPGAGTSGRDVFVLPELSYRRPRPPLVGSGGSGRFSPRSRFASASRISSSHSGFP